MNIYRDINNLIKNFSCLIITKRYSRTYRKFKTWPNDFLPFYWERPKKIPGFLNSGDIIRGIGIWNPKAFKLGYELSDELKKAPEIVQRQFTLEFANRRDILEFQYYHILKQMQRHPFDFDSPEARITRYTVKIRNLLEHFGKHFWAAPQKTKQVAMIHKRDKLLNKLYYQNYENYKFITESLKIDHKPPPLGRIVDRIERKREIRKLTTEYCNKLINEKVASYKNKLKSQQEEFLEEKKQVMKWIEEQEKFLGLTASDDKNHPDTAQFKTKNFILRHKERKTY